MCQKQGMQMGLTKVFFQQKAFNSVEKLRTSVVARAAVAVQAFWRMASCRRAYLVRMGFVAVGDGSRRTRGLAACRIQRLARRYIRAVTKSRREVRSPFACGLNVGSTVPGIGHSSFPVCVCVSVCVCVRNTNPTLYSSF